MKKLDKFVLKAFVGPFVAILAVVLFILVMQFLWLYIDELVGKGLGMGVILEFMGWGCATLLPLALPLATLLSAVMTMGTLGENNELLAFKAAGVSLARIFTPVIIVSVLISVGAFFASNDLVPKAYSEIYTLRDDILHTKGEIKIPAQTFYDGIDGYILRVDSRDDVSGMMRGVIVYDHTSNKGNVSLSIADSALMKISKDKSYLTFTLFSGTNYEETNTRKFRDTTLQLQKIDFTRQDMVIPLENYAFKKSEESRFNDQVKAKRLSQLRYDRDSLGRLNDEAMESNIRDLGMSILFVRGNQLDSAGVAGISRNFECEDFGKWNDPEEEQEAYENARQKANEMVSTLTGFTRDRYQYVYLLRKIAEGILSKYALALACFVFFFVGGPLGALIRKGGLGTPAIVSVLFFVLYWVVDVMGRKLASDGAISSWIGVFISTIVLIPIGIFLTHKAVTDTPVFKSESFKSWFRQIKSKIVGMFRKTRIVYMGTPEFAVAPLEKLISTGHSVVAVVTVADKASGRGLKVNESAVKKYAVEHNIPVLQPVSLKDPDFIESLKGFKPDMFVVVAFRMLPRVVWEIPRLGTFNLHAALLPQYRGAAPINWAVINGDNITGVTSFMIDDGMDTGKIMIREQCRISDTDTAGDVHDKLMEIGAETVVQTVDAIIEGEVEYRLQKSFIQGAEVLRPAPKITRELCFIDWDAPVKTIYNLIRGLSPYPGAFTMIGKGDGASTQLKIFKTAKVYGNEYLEMLEKAGLSGKVPAGTIISDGKDFLAIAAKDGALDILEVQLSGKKRMDIHSFLIGFRDPMSYSTEKGTSVEFCSKIGC